MELPLMNIIDKTKEDKHFVKKFAFITNLPPPHPKKKNIVSKKDVSR
jgi:hypothetical protein